MKRFTVAMDSYKGSLSSVEAGSAVRRGILRVLPDAKVVCIPIADGGEGTFDAYLAACGGTRVEKTVSDPRGQAVRAAYARLPDGTAVIEMAASSGLPLVPAAARDPKTASTRGFGELILDALSQGARDFILGIGGSATNDGGAGMLSALGVRFLDGGGAVLPDGGAALEGLARIDLAGLDARLAGCRIRVACDVDNPLCGERGASAVFGPQKGADEADVALLDRALSHYADVAEAALGVSVRDDAGAGAAGGLGFALKAFLGASLVPGVGLLLETAKFDEQLSGCDCVISGEGATDFQTAYGKAPVGVSRRAAARGIPAFLLSGTLGRDYSAVYREGVTAAFSIADRPMTLEYAIENAAPLLEAAAERLTRTLCAGWGIKV
ncbi:MAG: glycerate kinase [Eubacteriales bacterium]|nr:glycerate kinase [Eubacteriales bacterium]